MDTYHSNIFRLVHAEADMHYNLYCFGDHIAKRENYKHFKGIEAIHHYLVQKYGWTPATVRTMSLQDINFLLEEEMEDWTLPLEARP